MSILHRTPPTREQEGDICGNNNTCWIIPIEDGNKGERTKGHYEKVVKILLSRTTKTQLKLKPQCYGN